AGHRGWRAQRLLDPRTGWRGPRYVALHTLSHLLMREVALECGYGSASLAERLYCRSPGGPGDEAGPMAGILLYTAAPDSEGTLGGLVSLGEPESLERLLGQALRGAALCASDPMCAEHRPSRDDPSLHGAACHACLFAPETSCERANRYLDRTLVVDTFCRSGLGLLAEPGQTAGVAVPAGLHPK
ncbi:MAG: DrmB family protein, partial [Acidimicrobiales bacterium]